ncbi:hypothetical protein PMIN07_004014 [Paraphaeosphaeria minitans]
MTSQPTADEQAAASRDAVSRAIQAFAVAERSRNFHFLARNSHHRVNEEDLSVYRTAPKDIPTSTKRGNVNPGRLFGSLWYTFHQARWGITDNVALRYWFDAHQALLKTVLDARLDIKLHYIEVLDLDDTKCWMPLCDWMRKKYEWHDDRDWKQRGGSKLQLENQITWWSLNGKHFSFLDLPAELRNTIYPMILEPGIGNPEPQVQYVNRQIHNEAMWIRALSTKSLCLSSRFTKLNDGSIQNLPRMLSLKRLRLQLSAACYFELIGLNPQRGAPFAELEQASERIIPLKQLPELEQLDLSFIEITHPDAQCPWGGISAGHSCQKTWIDWFFTFALEHLFGKHVCVIMSGCVPDSVRAKWEPILKDAQYGHIRDMAASRAAIRRTREIDLRIKCLCTVPCSLRRAC